MKKGAKSGFVTKMFQDASLDELEVASIIGDIAVSPGGRLARKYFEALYHRKQFPNDAGGMLEIKSAETAILTALREGNVSIFRDITEYLKSVENFRKGAPPKVPELNETLLLFHFCRWSKSGMMPADIVESMITASPILRDLHKRCPFVPRKRHVMEFLEERFGDEAPDARTVGRYISVIRKTGAVYDWWGQWGPSAKGKIGQLSRGHLSHAV